MSAGFTHVVTFTNLETGEQTLPIPADVVDISDRVSKDAARRTWEARISADARYPAGGEILAGHLIAVPFLSGGMAIGKPKPSYGALPELCVRFEEEN